MAARKDAVNDGSGSATTGRQRSLANLRPWKKGQSGNPRGPKPDPYKAAILGKISPDVFAKAIAEAVDAGDSRILSALLDRHFPKPEVAVKLQASGPDGGPIPTSIQVEYVDPDDTE